MAPRRRCPRARKLGCVALPNAEGARSGAGGRCGAGLVGLVCASDHNECCVSAARCVVVGWRVATVVLGVRMVGVEGAAATRYTGYVGRCTQ